MLKKRTEVDIWKNLYEFPLIEGHHSKLEEIINKKKFGELIRLDMFVGHGLAFKEGFEESWRANEKNALLETVLSHLINL